MKKRHLGSNALLVKVLDENQGAKAIGDKLPYSSPRIAFIPQKLEERGSKPLKTGTFTVPLGCC